MPVKSRWVMRISRRRRVVPRPNAFEPWGRKLPSDASSWQLAFDGAGLSPRRLVREPAQAEVAAWHPSRVIVVGLYRSELISPGRSLAATSSRRDRYPGGSSLIFI